MSDAIIRMTAILLQTPPWKPDRFSVQREKVCTRCKVKKNLEKFGFAASVCKECHNELTKQRRKNRKHG